jgi:hypothetical protein
MMRVASVLGTNRNGDQVMIGRVTYLHSPVPQRKPFVALSDRTTRMTDSPRVSGLILGFGETIAECVVLVVEEYKSFGLDRPE